MKNKKFKIILGFLVIVIISLTVILYWYNKPFADIENSDAAYVMTAQNLITEYKKNETDTDKKYTEHIIQVEGELFDIATVKGSSVVTLKEANAESGIICYMLPMENRDVLRLEKGQQISIKGVCTGYLLDVIMVRCILAE